MRRTAVVALVSAFLFMAVTQAQGTGPNPAGQRPESLDARWQAERAGMLTQVLGRARTHVRHVQLRVEIGTIAPIDVIEAQRSLTDIEKLVDADAKRTDRRPVTRIADIGVLRLRFAQALNELDLAEVRFDNGMISIRSMGAALLAAANVLIAPAPPGAPSDAQG